MVATVEMETQVLMAGQLQMEIGKQQEEMAEQEKVVEL